MNEENINKSDLSSVKVEQQAKASIEINMPIPLIPSEIETRLISELKLEIFSAQYRKEILEKCLGLIGNEIMIRILNELSDQDSGDFDAFLEKEGGADPQALYSFLLTKLPNLDMLIKESFEKRLHELKPIYNNLHKDFLAGASEISKINKKYDRLKLISKVVVWLVSWLVSWLVVALIFYALAKAGIVPLDWLIDLPKWVQRIFQ